MGQTKGSKDGRYVNRNRRPPKAEEKMQKDMKTAATKAINKVKKDTNKKAQAQLVNCCP